MPAEGRGSVSQMPWWLAGVDGGMAMKWLGALIVLIVSTCLAAAAWVSFSAYAPSGGGGGNVTFVALHTYYLNASGNDNCNGTSPSLGSSGNCAWATPSHAVNCGDVIIAASGLIWRHSKALGDRSAHCPSTSGGLIGRTGGVYFATLLCGGTSVGDCYVTTGANDSGNTENFMVQASNWAIEGWYVNSSLASGGLASHMGARLKLTAVQPHICIILLFINDISADNLQAADTNDCGVHRMEARIISPWSG